MKPKNIQKLSISLALLLSIFLIGCADQQQSTAPTSAAQHQPVQDAPEWVMRGAGAFEEGSSRIFYGVGAVQGIRNKALARKTADNRARADISQIFDTYSSSLMKDYSASTMSQGNTSEEQHVEQAIKTVSINTLRGVIIVDHYIDREDDTFYSLAKLDMQAFRKQLTNIGLLDDAAKEAIKQSADKVFKDLSKQENKR
ncbi:MAG: LPP20 family lipoprotein [SAR324 cluster bacterium]|nr:LPP20 family lipoprotein [SAR324 cluster bacterium]